MRGSNRKLTHTQASRPNFRLLQRFFFIISEVGQSNEELTMILATTYQVLLLLLLVIGCWYFLYVFRCVTSMVNSKHHGTPMVPPWWTRSTMAPPWYRHGGLKAPWWTQSAMVPPGRLKTPWCRHRGLKAPWWAQSVMVPPGRLKAPWRPQSTMATPAPWCLRGGLEALWASPWCHHSAAMVNSKHHGVASRHGATKASLVDSSTP